MSMPLATAKQTGLLRRLLSEREVTDDLKGLKPEALTIREASSLIAALLQTPKVNPGDAQNAVALTEGVYELPDGRIVRVKRGKESGKAYAKLLVQVSGKRMRDSDESTVQWDYQYRPGLVREVSPDTKVTLERAKELSIRYGQCLWCGKRLWDAKSVELGIGPVCRKRMGGNETKR